MTRVGLPVPPGFIVTTEACNAYLAAGEHFPEGMWEQELEALKAIEQETGKKLGDPSNPLLVSCRSGAKFSMPGMMDTVLNIGMNDEVVEGMAKLTGDARFAYDSFRRLIQMFGSVVMGIDDEPFEEVLAETRSKAGVKTEAQLTAEHWKEVARKSLKKKPAENFRRTLMSRLDYRPKLSSRAGSVSARSITVMLLALPTIWARPSIL
jgi:pyruvate,orthophosphate dikinase